ncbi:MAG: FAD-dependent oxidoreductase [Streptomyces sp.]|nr:FAD-dependent oxidoreductase [Streptomyces sp.]
MYDLVVIGGRCAGAATALLLAESGHRVLMVEQARFPSDAMSTLYIHQPGVARLHEWGVLGTLLETGCPKLKSLSHTMGSISVSGPLPEYEGIDFALAPRRHVLDQTLADAAQAAGVEFRTQTKLVDVVRREGRVAGVLLRGPHGTVSEELGRVVVGADGMRSTLARLCGAVKTVEDVRRTCVYYTGWRMGGDQVRLAEARNTYVSVIPTHDETSLIATYAPQAVFEHARTDPMRFHLETIGALAPDLHDRLRHVEPALRLTGTGDQQNFFREASGKGWALVGDAGHHKDSITARGITDAFLQAELLAQVLAGRCGSDRAVDAALAEFARRRDGLLMESYTATLTAADLKVTGRRLAVHERIRDSAALTQVYLGVLAGMRPAEELVYGSVR